MIGRAESFHRDVEGTRGRGRAGVHLDREPVDAYVVQAGTAQPRRDPADLLRARAELAHELPGREVLLVARRRRIPLVGEQCL